MKTPERQLLAIGQFGAPHGLKGHIKLQSWAEPPASIFELQPWYLQHANQTWAPVEATYHSQTKRYFVASLPNYTTIEQAQQLKNLTIYIDRQQLPTCQDGEHYWSDLEGLEVINTQQQHLGCVDHVFAVGDNSMLAIKGQHNIMLPFDSSTIAEVTEQHIMVHWQPPSEP